MDQGASKVKVEGTKNGINPLLSMLLVDSFGRKIYTNCVVDLSNFEGCTQVVNPLIEIPNVALAVTAESMYFTMNLLLQSWMGSTARYS